jgi:hypothetical protein
MNIATPCVAMFVSGSKDLILIRLDQAMSYAYTCVFFNGFAPDIGTTVKFLGSVFLISTLKKSFEIIKDMWGQWPYFGVTRF